MSKRRYELDTRVLTIFFFVAMPFVAFGSFLVVSMARSALQDSLGVSLEQRAVETRFLIERYVGDQIVHLRLVALDPQIRAALTTPSKERSREDARRLEQAWIGADDPKLVAGILRSPLAARLRTIARVRPALKLLQVVDAQGRLLAASARAGRLLNAETRWFRGVTGEGAERAYVGDIQRPAGAALPLLEIAYPIYDGEARFVGALRALTDATDLYSVIAPVRVGRTGHALLVRASDGLILASDEVQRILTRPIAGFDIMLSALDERRGFRVIPEVREAAAGGEAVLEPARLVGFSPVEQIPNVDWLVVVEQDLQEAMAPVQELTRYLWTHFIGAFGSVILLALYLSFKLETPVIEEALHLHGERGSSTTSNES